MDGKRKCLILAFILILGLVLRLSFFMGFLGSDDIGYYDTSYRISQAGRLESEDYHAKRIGIVYPTAFFYSLFGINEFTSNLLPLSASMLAITLVYFLGAFLFGDKTGLMAAFLLSVYPVNVMNSTMLLADFPAAFFAALGAYLFLRAERKRSISKYLLSGMAIGAAYLMMELSLLILLFFAAYAIYKKRLKKEYVLVAAGFLIVFSFEMLYHMSQGQSPLSRLVQAESASTDFVKAHFYNYFGSKLWLRWFVHYPYIVLSEPGARYFYILFFVSAAYFAVKRKKETYPLLLWIIPIFLFLNFGSNSLASYVPLPAILRYLELITIPCIVLSAYFLGQKIFPGKKYVMPGIIILLLLLSIFSLHFNEVRVSNKNLREAKDYLETRPQKPVYTDLRTAEILKYLFGYKMNSLILPFSDYRLVNFTEAENTILDMRGLHDSYVLVDRARINVLTKNNKGIKFPEEIQNPPKNWILEKSFGSEEKVIVYHIP